ncbi:hypothetical protein BDW67DRAFT_112126 [Aspergillus spinulosporus]
MQQAVSATPPSGRSQITRGSIWHLNTDHNCESGEIWRLDHGYYHLISLHIYNRNNAGLFRSNITADRPSSTNRRLESSFVHSCLSSPLFIPRRYSPLQ